ncbi:DUF6338 family protein [Microbacterium sp. Bi128]|uniref:DUF6338 family protein n=1 Tax=Microbacterium sp. Bi128 TaxID=2821115 RepID=UPI001DBCEFA6|nr:DUF6338 family protein [Microbacterium sp. Bi128]CAH0227521.1 hypothetical protein SRABI128_02354 [Microbacterium sp. Bi128]
MDVLQSSFAVATFVVLALPGLVFVAVRRWARGEAAEDRDFGLSLARGSVFALALTGVYVLMLGDAPGVGVTFGADADALVVSDARRLALTVLVLYLAVPAMLSLILNRQHITWERSSRLRWVPLPRSRHGYSNTPSPWDHAARKHQDSWVKINRANGDWIGGWVTHGSFMSAYPEARAIYIDQQYAMTKDGNFNGLVPGAGVFLSIADDDVVIWIRPANPTTKG